MYDVESLGDDKDDKIDLLPPIYSRDVQQPQGHIKFLSIFFSIKKTLVIAAKTLPYRIAEEYDTDRL